MKSKIGASIRTGCWSIILAMVGISQLGAGTTYYVSGSSGDDNRTTTQARDVSTPWQTIQKAALNMGAGDTCQIRAGTYVETVTLSSSGVSGSPITFKPYGSEVVTISGVVAVGPNISDWTNTGGNIYSTPMTWTMTDSNQVFYGNKMLPEARWPNAASAYPWQNTAAGTATSDWAYIDTADNVNSPKSFTDSALLSRSSVPDYWKGATLNIMAGYGWYMKSVTVQASSGAFLTTDYESKYTSNVPYALTGSNSSFLGNEYYLSGLKSELDQAGEWFYESSTGKLFVYNTSTPTKIFAKKNEYGFDLTGKSYITLQGLKFFACTIQTNTQSNNLTLDGVSMFYLRHTNKAYKHYGLTLYGNSVVKNCELAYASSGLINIAGDYVRIFNNKLHEVGYMPDGVAMIDSSKTAKYALISHNSLYNAGRAIIGIPGVAAIIENNDMYNAMRLSSDGGVMYWGDANGDGATIRYNAVHDSLGAVGHLGGGVAGIYLDSLCSNYVIHHNAIYYLSGYGFKIGEPEKFNCIFNNTCASTGSYGFITHVTPTRTGEDDIDLTTGTLSSGTKVFNNIIGTALSNSISTSDSLASICFGANLYSTPSYISGTLQVASPNSSIINAGVIIPGITDTYPGGLLGAPDIGAFESGSTNWMSSNIGYKSTPISPEPTYSNPTAGMDYVNQVKDGSFEGSNGLASGVFSSSWTKQGTGVASFMNSSGAWWNLPSRSELYSAVFTGTGTVSQVLSGLKPNRTYIFYVGVYTSTSAAPVTFGVRNFNGAGSNQSQSVSNTYKWDIETITFTTGPSPTAVEIYMSCANSTGIPVYVDDIAVIPVNVTSTMSDWRNAYFGSDEDAGAGATLATPKGDGVPNLMRYANDRVRFSELIAAWPGDVRDHTLWLACCDNVQIPASRKQRKDAAL